MPGPSIREKVADYYTRCVREHGETPRGVDWNSEQSQRLRFRQLLRILPPEAEGFSILDYGCGYGALVDELVLRGCTFHYLGYDLAQEMVQRARRRHPEERCTFSTNPADLGTADYAVSSGVFNVKLDVPAAEWEDYVHGSLEELDRLGTRGFAFNALTSYSDAHRKVNALYYADPCRIFDHCKRCFSPHVALLHDYGLYEFTVLVRKDLP